MPQHVSQKVTLSLPDELLAFADAKAVQQGTTRSRLIGDLLEEFRQRERAQPAAEGARDFAPVSRSAAAQAAAPLPPISLELSESRSTSSWRREDIYEDDGR